MHSIKKKPYTAIFTLLLFISSVLSAQTNNPLINSGEIIQNGIKLHDEKKYEEAIKEIKKIDRSDTNYYKALYQISFSYYIDSQFNKSLEYVRLGLQLFPEKYSLFAMQAANSLDDMNRSEEAIKIYDSAMVKEPQDFLLYFNKGVVNYKLKNYNEAKKNMQQCLLINPYYSSAHYFLGSIYLLHGNLVPALLAFKTYLLISPSGKYYVNTINNLTDIAKVTDQVLEFVKNKSASKEDNFNVQQEILLSKLALDKQYKLKAELEDNIVRQIQVVDEKLEYNKNDKGFCMQFYAPFYINILKEGNFETMIFYIFSGISNKKIETWNKNNKREKDAFIDKASSYFDTIKKTQVLDPAKREDADINYLYDKNNFFGKGSLSKDKVPHYIGKWDFYYENGGIQATGNFNESGEKNGPWVYYYENGQVKEKSNSVNGVLKGLAEGWFNNGIKWYSQNYSDGKINGEQTINYFNGKSKSIITFKDGLKNGP